MARKGRSTEEIIAALREAEVKLDQGETVGKICRGLGISEQTYYVYGRLSRCKRLDQGPGDLVWRREGLKVPKKQPKRGRLWLNDG